jgi:hypothetical protein
MHCWREKESWLCRLRKPSETAAGCSHYCWDAPRVRSRTLKHWRHDVVFPMHGGSCHHCIQWHLLGWVRQLREETRTRETMAFCLVSELFGQDLSHRNIDVQACRMSHLSPNCVIVDAPNFLTRLLDIFILPNLRCLLRLVLQDSKMWLCIWSHQLASSFAAAVGGGYLRLTMIQV